MTNEAAALTTELSSWIGRDLPPIYRDGVEHFLLAYAGQLYLVPNRCPHRGGPLKFGHCNARGEIVCPMHGNAFAIPALLARPGVIRLLEARVGGDTARNPPS